MDASRQKVITVVFDRDTCRVGMDIQDVEIGLAQMMLDEAVRQLDFLRRKANLIAAQQEAVDAALAASLTGAGRHRG